MTEPHGTPESHDEQDHAPDAAAGHGDHHDGDTLGPVDWRMWLVGVLGVALAAVTLAGFVVATEFRFLAGAG